MESQNLFSSSELAQAAYADLSIGNTIDLPNQVELKRDGGGAGMTATQAEQFANRFIRVVAVSEDPLDTGFSATVFESESGELVLAIRGTDKLLGTDGDDDYDIAVNGPASQQIVEMHNWWNRVTTEAGSSVDQLKYHLR